MATYDYECEKCGTFEIDQKISEPALTNCPNCGHSVRRLISATAFHLKGSGWYKTDYSNSSSSNGKSAKTSSADSSTTAESKPAEKTASEVKTESKPESKAGCGSGCGCK